MVRRLSKMFVLRKEHFPLLNELAELSRSLASGGIHAPMWHPWIKSFKKGDALVAEVDPLGVLNRIGLLSPDEVSKLQNIVKDNHNSFPGFNLNCPLMELKVFPELKQPEFLWKEAQAITSESLLKYEKKDLGRLANLFRSFPQEIAPRLKGGGRKVSSTLALLQRLTFETFAPETFLHGLALQIVAAVREGRLPRETGLAILYGKPNKNSLRMDPWQITLILDVADVDSFSYRVADPAVPSEWSVLLLQSDLAGGSAPNEKTVICGLTGQTDVPIGDKMPSPNLPILGPTYLMSMNADVPCQTRYGRTSTKIFPAGMKSIQNLNNAIRFITDPRRRNTTWTGVPSSFNDKSDLLITYLDEEPYAEVPLAGLFADIEADDQLKLATYEARTQHIHQALRLIEKRGRDLHIRVIALSQIDKGRKQVIFSGCYSTAAVYRGRDNWLAGARNIPDIAVPFPTGKGKPAEWRSGYFPSPNEAMSSFKEQWLRGGQLAQRVPGVELSRIYALMLDPDAHSQAKWLLDKYVPLTQALMIGLARFLAQGPNLPQSFRKNLDRALPRALVVIAVYGILLYRQDRKKEIYMEGRDYLLGQFLQFSDRLHKLYCEHERKGSMPPQLIGNAAVSMAIQSPNRALQVLSQRMLVYLAWADRYKGVDAGLVKWTRKELGRISADLRDTDLSLRVAPNGKAELLLGYLANTKSAQKQEEKAE
jgi:hypothetical protein